MNVNNDCLNRAVLKQIKLSKYKRDIPASRSISNEEYNSGLVWSVKTEGFHMSKYMIKIVNSPQIWNMLITKQDGLSLLGSISK